MQVAKPTEFTKNPIQKGLKARVPHTSKQIERAGVRGRWEKVRFCSALASFNLFHIYLL